MALVRTALVAAAVIALLPSDRAQQERLQQTAIDAAHWTITFCDRNAKMCENAGVAWDIFKSKAQFAAGVAYDVAMTHVLETAGIETASTPERHDPVAAAEAARGTLTARDLEPGWRGAPQRRP